MNAPSKEPDRRKLFRRTVDERLDFIQSVVDGLSEPITIINKQYQLICLNKAARELAPDNNGLPKSLICYMCNHGKDIPCTESEYSCPVNNAKVTGKPVTVVHENTLPNKEVRSFEIVATPLWSRDGAFQGIVESLRDITDRRRTEQEREHLIAELQRALSKVKALSGLLPICASCKNIRDDRGYWKRLEEYISDHSEAEFSHGICPVCAQKLYGKDFEQEK